METREAAPLQPRSRRSALASRAPRRRPWRVVRRAAHCAQPDERRRRPARRAPSPAPSSEPGGEPQPRAAVNRPRRATLAEVAGVARTAENRDSAGGACGSRSCARPHTRPRSVRLREQLRSLLLTEAPAAESPDGPPTSWTHWARRAPDWPSPGEPLPAAAERGDPAAGGVHGELRADGPVAGAAVDDGGLGGRARSPCTSSARCSAGTGMIAMAARLPLVKAADVERTEAWFAAARHQGRLLRALGARSSAA